MNEWKWFVHSVQMGYGFHQRTIPPKDAFTLSRGTIYTTNHFPNLVHLNPEDRGSMFFCKVGNYLSDYPMSQWSIKTKTSCIFRNVFTKWIILPTVLMSVWPSILLWRRNLELMSFKRSVSDVWIRVRSTGENYMMDAFNWSAEIGNEGCCDGQANT